MKKLNCTKTIVRISASALLLACSSSGTNDDGGPDEEPVPDCDADSSATGGLVINEIMAANALTLVDDDGNAFDWMELHNTTNADVSLCGWQVTRVLDGASGYKIVHDNTVPAGGKLVIYMTNDAEPAADRVPLHLKVEGGELGLIAPNGTFSDRIVYDEQAVDFSAARQPDGGDEWTITWHPTPGEPNSQEPAVASVEDPQAPPEMVPGAGDLSEIIMGYDQMLSIGLVIDEAGIDSLRENPREYVRGNLVYDGREYGPVGIKLKGQNSFQPIDEKPSFRINIDEYAGRAKFFGLDDLTLNNMDNDFSMMHERLSYLVARQMGPASRANHALVELNGTFYGLYANVETVKRQMIRRWFEDDSGALFEGTDVDFVSELIPNYELEAGADDRTVLYDLASALTNPNADAAMAAASAYVDMESFFQYWAMCAIVGQFDAFPYSGPGDDYFIYINPTSGKIAFLPWGMDETFYSSSFPVNQIQSVLAQKCLASPSCYQAFADHTWDALELIEAMDLEAERARVVDEVRPHVIRDKRKAYDDAMVTEFQNQLRFFIQGRRSQMTAQLPPRTTP